MCSRTWGYLIHRVWALMSPKEQTLRRKQPSGEKLRVEERYIPRKRPGCKQYLCFFVKLQCRTKTKPGRKVALPQSWPKSEHPDRTSKPGMSWQHRKQTGERRVQPDHQDELSQMQVDSRPRDPGCDDLALGFQVVTASPGDDYSIMKIEKRI